VNAVKNARTTRRLAGSVALLVTALGLPVLNAARSQALPTPAKVTVSPNPVYVVASQYAYKPVSATVLDGSSPPKPVANQAVAWQSSGGASFNPATSVTNAQGVATTTAVYDGVRGKSTITANAGTASGTATLYEYSQSANLSLKLQPSALPPDGSSTSLATLTVTDSNNPPDPVPEGVVTMTSNGDVSISPVTNRGDGTYVATITASHTAGVETITATHTFRTLPTLSTTAQLSEYGSATAVTVSLSRPSIPATGVAQPQGSSLHLNDSTGFSADPYEPDPAQPAATATVTDANGSRVPNEVVQFSASGGATFGPVTNNGDGTYTASLTSSTHPGTETITARATSANVSGSTTLRETFGALHTAPGNTNILDADGNPVTLRGLNLDPQGYTDKYLIQRYFRSGVYDQIRNNWNANAVRAFIDLDQWMQPCAVEQQQNQYDPNYRRVYQEYAKAATQRGMFVTFVLGRNPKRLCDVSGPQMMAERDIANPADDAAHFWTSVANTFKDNPMVGFELFNEPHSIVEQQPPYRTKVKLSDAAWLNGGTIACEAAFPGCPEATPTWTAAGMQEMYNAIRATGATNLVIVDGQGWANLTPPALISSAASTTYASDYPATNIVYNLHYYSCPSYTAASQTAPASYNCSGGPQPQPTDTCATTPTPGYQIAATRIQPWVTWRSTNGVPVMENEFGWPNNTNAYDSCFIQNTINFDEANNVSWLAYAWFGWDGPFNLSSHPDSGDYTPTISGLPVKNGLANNQN
jgi:hypothetical protein